MGTDDIFKKRRAKRTRDLARRKARRGPYAKVLIVCEGEKTEPNYFREMIAHYKISSANVVITGDCGASPIHVVEFAIQRYRSEKNTGDPFDKIFCVFDKDTHSSYSQALDILRRAKPKNTFFAITSVPCFEYWLLLHYGYTTRPYEDVYGRSTAHQVISDLKKQMPTYEKKQKGIFLALFSKLESAKKYAAQGLKHAAQSGTDNPSTRVHELVDFLQNIKK